MRRSLPESFTGGNYEGKLHASSGYVSKVALPYLNLSRSTIIIVAVEVSRGQYIPGMVCPYRKRLWMVVQQYNLADETPASKFML
ncbi:MAG: hypothetical protein ACLP05_05510 [Candidatus Kryptoniota bacterium]